MNYNLSISEYETFLDGLPNYNYQQKIKMLRPFLQRVSENVIKHLQPNVELEWFSFDMPDVTISNDKSSGETWYLINSSLPPKVSKDEANFIPKNRFEFIKTNYIKATLQLTYEYVNPRAGDCYDNWYIEFLSINKVLYTLMNNYKNIFVTANGKIVEFENALPELIKNSI